MLQRRGWIVACVLGVSVAAGCSSDSEDAADTDGDGAGDTAGTDGELDFSGFDDAIDTYLAANGLEGATAAVVHRDLGIVHVKGYGSFDPERLILLASASKTLSVGVLVRLDDEEIIDIDAPLSSYVTEWEGSRDFTVAQMVSNSSGLLGLIDDPTYAPYLCQYIITSDLSDCAEAIHGTDDADTRVPPDTQYRYGGAQWQLAGGVAELKTGKRWPELVRETYIDTCGMDTLGYNNQYQRAFFEGSGVSGAVEYPDYFQGDPANLDPTDNPNLEGGGYIAVEDYAEFLYVQLSGGLCTNGERALSAEGVARMQEDRILAAYGGSAGVGGDLEGYGLGWFVDRNAPGLVVDPGAYGSTPWLDTERGYGAVVLLEGSGGDSAIRTDAQAALEAVFDAYEPPAG